jgi:hypothetical protein
VRWSYLERDYLHLGHFVYLCLTKYTHYSRRTNDTEVVVAIDIHNADDALDGPLVFVAKLDSVE